MDPTALMKPQNANTFNAQGQMKQESREEGSNGVLGGGEGRIGSAAPPSVSLAPSVSHNTMIRRQYQAQALSLSFEQIQSRLQEVLDNVERQFPLMGLEILVVVTDSVVQNVERLGLTSDDVEFGIIDREGFWSGLNRCWLYALAHSNAQVTDESLRPQGQHLAHFRSCIITWCDKLERYGLVDYEMGFWETEILEALSASEEAMLSRTPIPVVLPTTVNE